MSQKKYQFAILLIGLDGSGKTTIVKSYQKPTKAVHIQPTVGFQVELVQIPACSRPVAVFDCSGNGRHRPQWEMFLGDSDAIAFVIDSSDKGRLHIVREYLKMLFLHPQVVQKMMPIGLLCSKSDHSEAIEKEEIKELLQLTSIPKGPDINYFLNKVSAYEGTGVSASFELLA